MAPQLTLASILDEAVDETWKGIPGGVRGLRIGDVGGADWNLAAGDLPLPVLALRRSALEHNLSVLRRFCDECGALLAPHGKTTMAPQLFERQLAAGAWALTAASVQQLQVYRRFGAPRVIVANQVVGDAELAWLGNELARDAGFECWTLVDSAAAVERLAVAGRRAGKPVGALLELGLPRGRTGARDRAAVDDVLRALTAHAGWVELAGIEAFEGTVAFDRAAAAHDHRIDALLDRVAETTHRLRSEGALPPDHLVSAGGSLAFDVVAARLAPEVTPPARLVLRSGCSLIHDHGIYASGSPLAAGASPWAGKVGALQPALELWAHVLAQPEPGRAVLGLGRRDAPFDSGLPVPLRHLAGPHGRAGRAVTGWAVDRLDDQHAYLACPPGEEPSVADRVVLGISHPCGAFDRWRLVFEIDDDDAVVAGIRTFF